jgi:hypothetical protein
VGTRWKATAYDFLALSARSGCLLLAWSQGGQALLDPREPLPGLRHLPVDPGQLLDDLPPAVLEGTQKARLKLRSTPRWSAPYFWAPFVLSGLPD